MVAKLGRPRLSLSAFALGVLLPSCGQDAATDNPTTTTTVATSCSSEGETRSCWTGSAVARGIGACRDGTESCVQGKWSSCSGEVLPTSEACDGNNPLDDDCDGIVDEGCSCELGTPPRACYGGSPTTIGIGICQPGEQPCEAGSWSSACKGEIVPQPETCDGLDNDCDGVADPGCSCVNGTTQPCYGGAPETEGVGICHSGQTTCAGGGWGACVGQVTPGAESCNGLDDDCDGASDEGDPGGGAECSTGQPGICADGVRHCQSGSPSCVPNQTPQSEICDGIDQNCNGTFDDGTSLPNNYDALEWIPPGWLGLGDGAFITWGGTLAVYDAATQAVTGVTTLADTWDALSTSGPQPPTSGIDSLLLLPAGFFGFAQDTLFVSAGSTMHYKGETDASWHSDTVASFLTTAGADAMTYFLSGDVPNVPDDFLLAVDNDWVRLYWLASPMSVPLTVAETFCANGSTGPCPPGIDTIMRLPGQPWAGILIQHGSTTYWSTFHTNANGIYYQWSTTQMTNISCAH